MKKKLNSLIGQAKFREAINLLLQLEKSDRDVAGLLDTIRILSGRLTQLDREKLNGTISEEDFKIEINRIAEALLEISKKIPEKDSQTYALHPERGLKPGNNRYVRGALIFLLCIAGGYAAWLRMPKSESPDPEVFKQVISLVPNPDTRSGFKDKQAELTLIYKNQPLRQSVPHNGVFEFDSLPIELSGEKFGLELTSEINQLELSDRRYTFSPDTIKVQIVSTEVEPDTMREFVQRIRLHSTQGEPLNNLKGELILDIGTRSISRPLRSSADVLFKLKTQKERKLSFGVRLRSQEWRLVEPRKQYWFSTDPVEIGLEAQVDTLPWVIEDQSSPRLRQDSITRLEIVLKLKNESSSRYSASFPRIQDLEIRDGKFKWVRPLNIDHISEIRVVGLTSCGIHLAPETSRPISKNRLGQLIIPQSPKAFFTNHRG